jgi:O-antigen/teichoic acid export membrane protein
MTQREGSSEPRPGSATDGLAASGPQSESDSSKPDVTRAQIRGSSLLLSGQVFAVLANLLTQILIVRYLSKEAYGAFAYALSIVTLGETIAAFGLRRGVGRFLPIYEERDQPDRAAGTLVFALAAVLTLGLAVVLVVIGLRGVIAGSVAGGTEATVLLAILILLAPIQALENLLDGVFAVFSRPRTILARRFVYSPLIRLAVVVLLVLSSSGVTFLAVGYVITGVIGLAVYSTLVAGALRRRGLLEQIRSRRLTFELRELLGFTTPLLTNDVSSALMNAAGTVLLGVMAGADEVATLRAVLPVALTLTYVLSAFGMLFVPLASRLYARGEGAELNRLYWQTAAWTAVLSFPVFALGFAFGTPLAVLLFGERYEDAGTVLAALVVGRFVTAAMGPNGVLLAVYARIRYIVTTNLLAIAVNLLLSVALIAEFGALGAAIAASATLVVLNGVRQVGLARRTDVRAADAEYAGLYTVVVLMTAALVVVQVALAPSLAVAVALVLVAWLGLLFSARRQLAVADTFPELARLPGLSRLLAAGGSRS